MTVMSQMDELKALLDINHKECEVQVCMAALVGDNGIPEFQLVSLGKDVAAEFGAIVGEHIARRKKDLGQDNLVLHSYEPGSKLDLHEIEYISLSDQSSIANQIKSLSDLSDLDTFDANDAFLKALRFYVIILRPKQGEPALCFRSYSSKKELDRSRLFAITLQKGHYDKLRDKVFLFDKYIDCIAYKNNIFILNKDKFQKVFKFYEELVKVADSVLQEIESCIPIDDFGAFRAACSGHLQKIAKLKNIANKPYLKDLTIHTIKEVIQRYNLPIKTAGNGDDEKLHYDASDKWAILRLLDDDYLESVMTKTRYEVNSKRSLK